MTRKTIVLAQVLLVGAAVLCAQSARGSALEDFQRGDAVHLDVFDAQIPVLLSDQEVQSTNVCIAKDPGSLDLTIPATALGIASSSAVYLSGVAAGDQITWTVSGTFDPPVPAPGGPIPLHIDQVTGTLVAKLTELSSPAVRSCDGTSPARPFAVHLDSVPNASQLNVHFPELFGFSQLTTTVGFSAIAGPIDPGSSDIVVLTGPQTLCENQANRTLEAWIGLSGPASRDGLPVTLSDTPGLVTSATAVVPPNQTGTIVPLTIQGGRSGDLVLTASTGTSSQGLMVHVKTAAECNTTGFVATPIALMVPAGGPTPCVTCGARLVGVGDGGDLLEAIQGDVVLVQNGKARTLPLPQGIQSASPIAFNASGQIAGTWLTLKGDTQGFLSSPFWNLAGSWMPLPGQPVAVDEAGHVVGTLVDASGMSHAYLASAGALHQLPLGSGASFGTAVDNRGLVAGNRWQKDQLRGFLSLGGQVVEGGDLGGGRSELFDVNGAGDAVGTALTCSHRWHATLVHPVGLLASGDPAEVAKLRGQVQTRDLGTLPGFTDSYATHINANGHVVGIAFGKRGQAAFLYTPEQGLVNLGERTRAAAADAPFEIESIIAFDDRDQVAVRGRASPGGALATFLLTPQVGAFVPISRRN